MKTLLILILTLIFITSCGGPAGKTNMQVSVGAITGSANFPGGLFVMGVSENGEKFSQKIPAGDHITLEVPNGAWAFIAMGWDGTEHFEGDVYCEVLQNISLTGGDFNLNLIATKAKCNHPYFGQKLSTATNDFLPLEFNSCVDLQEHIAADEDISDVTCNGSGEGSTFPGGMRSVQISMVNYAIGQNVTTGSKALTSKCYNFPTGSGLTNIKLPFGAADVYMPYVIDAYENADCNNSNGASVILFNRGLSTSSEQSLGVAFADTGNNKSKVFLHSDICSYAQRANSPFANGDPEPNDIRLICTPAQWQAISLDADSNSGEEYELGSDIDFTGSNTTIEPSLGFSGNIRGNGFSLKNGNAPLFGEIKSHAGGDVRISEINIEGFSIVDPAGASDIGILAKNVNSAGDGKGIEIEGIEISSSSIVRSNVAATGNMGGLIGRVNFANASDGESFFIRKNTSRANITSDAVGGTNLQNSIGGLVGYINGPNNSDNRTVALEINRVGYQSEDGTVVDRVNIVGDTKVGGLVGNLKSGEIRLANVAITNITAKSEVGGLVGLAQTSGSTNVRIEHSLGKMNFIPSAIASNIGGILGKGVNASNIQIKGVISEFIVPKTSTQINGIGGLVGYYNSNVADTFSIDDSRGILFTESNGQRYGGLIGEYVSTVSNSKDTIRNSVAQGSIDVDSDSGINIKRGGLAGSATRLRVSKSIAKMILIKGGSVLGGGFGYSNLSEINEAYVQATIEAWAASSYAGGLVGDHMAGITSYNNIKVYSVVSGTDSYCGTVVGQNQVSGNVVFTNIITQGAECSNNAPAAMGDACGGGGGCSGTEISNINYSDTSSCSSLGFSTPFLDEAATTCEIGFESRWRKYGYDAVDSYYLSGSMIEPFSIYTVDDWNAIGSYSFLMSKYFKLENDLDFTDGFTPIGTDNDTDTDKIFRGGIIPAGHKLSNIDLTTGSGVSAGGLFPIIEDAVIGLGDDPLVIEDSTIEAESPKTGIIGMAKHSSISIHANNILITDDDNDVSTSIGGLLGYANTDVRIDNSYFFGAIDTPNTVEVGGFIGSIDTVGSPAGSASIEDSFVDLIMISAYNDIGGMIGAATSGDYVSIRNSYVWVDKFNDNSSGNDLEALTGSNHHIGGFIGTAGTGVEVSIKESYVDIMSAAVGTGFSTLIASGTGATVSYTNVAIVDDEDKADGAYAYSPTDGTQYYTDHKVMADAEDFSYNDDHSSWALDGNDDLLISWEVNGFDDN